MAIEKMLASGGKRLPGSNAEHLFVRPAELANLMGDLIKVINLGREPKTDDLIDRYLSNRFQAEIEKEQMAIFHRDLFKYAKEVLCAELNRLNRSQTDEEKIDMDQRLKTQQQQLKKTCYDKMIDLAQVNILGLNSSLESAFTHDIRRQEVFHEFPLPLQHRFNILEIEMNNARDGEILVERTRNNFIIADLNRQAEEKQKLLEEIHTEIFRKNVAFTQEKRINRSLERAAHWRVRVAPCQCGASGKWYNMLHINCPSYDQGNLYYYNEESNRMVCDACRKILRCQPTDARCIDCERRVRVTKVYEYQ